jgi:hypothetical protein
MPPLGARSEPKAEDATGPAHRGPNPSTSRHPNFLGLLVFVSSYRLVSARFTTHFFQSVCAYACVVRPIETCSLHVPGDLPVCILLLVFLNSKGLLSFAAPNPLSEFVCLCVLQAFTGDDVYSNFMLSHSTYTLGSERQSCHTSKHRNYSVTTTTPSLWGIHTTEHNI